MQYLNRGILRHQSAERLNAHSQANWAIEAQAKTWTQPMMSGNSAYLTSLQEYTLVYSNLCAELQGHMHG